MKSSGAASPLVTDSTAVYCQVRLSPSETFVAVEPSRRGCSPVTDTVPGLGGNQKFFAHSGMMDPAGDLEFHIAIKDHHQLVHLMDIVFPYLARRIGPHLAAKAAGPPVASHGI